MYDGDLHIFQKLNLSSVKEIELNRGNLRSIDDLNYILPQLETLKFVHCKFTGDVDEKFLSHTSNLKRLYVKDTDNSGNQRKYLVGQSNQWLKNSYPSLEYFEVNSVDRIDEVTGFLQKNRNIHKFSCKIEFLVRNMHSIWSSGVELDSLAILHETSTLSQQDFGTFIGHLRYIH